MVDENKLEGCSESNCDDGVGDEENDNEEFLPPEEWPKTVKDAVDMVLGWLSDEEKEEVQLADTVDLHFGLGMAIRNEFGLWRSNEELLRDCALREGCAGDFPEGTPGFMIIHPDSASGVILSALKRTLKRAHEKGKKG